MANMFEKYAADREAEQEQRAEQERAARRLPRLSMSGCRSILRR